MKRLWSNGEEAEKPNTSGEREAEQQENSAK